MISGTRGLANSLTAAVAGADVQASASKIAHKTGDGGAERFLVLSTFRDAKNRQVLPHGLQWNMVGRSQIVYIPSQGPMNPIDTSNLAVRQALVDAHNLWCFAKSNARGGAMVFATTNDIQSVTQLSNGAVRVQWRELSEDLESVDLRPDIQKAVRSSAHSLDPGTCMDIYLNGRRHSRLVGPVSDAAVQAVLDAASQLRSMKICVRLRKANAPISSSSGRKSEGLKYEGGVDDVSSAGTARSHMGVGILRIERYFRGMVRGEEVFEHVVDNLLAFEDVKMLDDDTIIGTATLPDWIMGGVLTSRLWLRDDGDTVLALRPLYDDDVTREGGVDRRFQLKQGNSEEANRRIATIRSILEDARRLAAMAALVKPGTQGGAEGNFK